MCFVDKYEYDQCFQEKFCKAQQDCFGAYNIKGTDITAIKNQNFTFASDRIRRKIEGPRPELYDTGTPFSYYIYRRLSGSP